MASDLKLGLVLGYWFSGPPPDAPAQVAAAEDLGFDSCGPRRPTAPTASRRSRGGARRRRASSSAPSICQISARTPTATAMAALTLDHLSGGRFILGLGASGPQVVEGWYGQPYPKPLARTREYVEIVRRILAREEPVDFHGEHYQLPYLGDGDLGLGKPLKSITHPLRADLPIYLGAEGPKNVALAAEIADGWLPMFFSPKLDGFYRDALAEGFARPGARRERRRLRGRLHVPIIIDDDVERLRRLRPACRSASTSAAWARARSTSTTTCSRRMGYEAEVTQDPGPLPRRPEGRGDRVRAPRAGRGRRARRPGREDQRRARRWRKTCMTTMLVSGAPEQLRTIADLVRD